MNEVATEHYLKKFAAARGGRKTKGNRVSLSRVPETARMKDLHKQFVVESEHYHGIFLNLNLNSIEGQVLKVVEQNLPEATQACKELLHNGFKKVCRRDC